MQSGCDVDSEETRSVADIQVDVEAAASFFEFWLLLLGLDRVSDFSIKNVFSFEGSENEGINFVQRRSDEEDIEWK